MGFHMDVKAKVSKRHRSAVTNRSKLCLGIDGRSAQSRRFKDLMTSYAEPLGGIADLPEAAIVIVRQAAITSLECETLQSRALAGERIDDEQLVRLSNSISRLLATLKGLKKPKKTGPTLDEIVARHGGSR